jgi:hypothetical protein
VSSIEFKDVGCTLLNHSFVMNVGQFYALYDIKRKTPMGVIKVVRIEEKGFIYYRDVNDYTDNGEFTNSVIKKYVDAGPVDEPPVFITNIRLGTAEKYILVTNISGTDTSKPIYSVSELRPMEGAIREGGRSKRGRKSKKYSKTKSKSRTRRGGGMTDSEIRKIKDQIKRLALSEDHETIDCGKYVANYDDIYNLWSSLETKEDKEEFAKKFVEVTNIPFLNHSRRVPLYETILKDLKETDSHIRTHLHDLYIHKTPSSCNTQYKIDSTTAYGGKSRRRRRSHHRGATNRKHKKARKSRRRHVRS